MKKAWAPAIVALTAVALSGAFCDLAAQQAAEHPQSAPQARPANLLSEIAADSVFATTLLVLPMTGSYAQHGEAIGKIVGYAAPKGIMRGMPLGIYHNSPAGIPEDSLRWEICVPVAPEAAAEPPFILRHQPDMLAVSAVCTGPFEGAGSCHAAVMEWIPAHGYTATGPAQEHWLSDPSSVPPEKQETRIVVPVEPAEKE